MALIHFAHGDGRTHCLHDEVLVRVHISNVLCDLTSSTREECGWPLQNALQRIAKEGRGIVVILQQPQNSDQLIRVIQNHARRDQGLELPATPSTSDLRTYGLGAQILLDLGVKKMRILSAPKKIHAISGFGLEVVDYVTN
jgi:3,4-dihydroxy 2-butanone 4-phosphate synthase / GTP cyclohydrolase II